MPTYEYECKKCSVVFEVFQKITEEPIKTCPECKGPVRRLIGSGIGVIFKGSGFYTTDYKNKRTQTSSKSSNGRASSNTTKKQEKSKPGDGVKDQALKNKSG
jgi:putative FmdB family regulatory protein